MSDMLGLHAKARKPRNENFEMSARQDEIRRLTKIYY